MADAETSNASQVVVSDTDDVPAEAQNVVVSADSAASTSSAPAAVPAPHAPHASSTSSPSPSSHPVASFPPRDSSPLSRTPSSSSSVAPSRGPAPQPAPTESATEVSSNAVAASGTEAGSSAPHSSQPSENKTRAPPPSAVSQGNQRVGAPSNSLPSPPRTQSGRTGDAQAVGDGGSSTSSQASPNVGTDHLRVAGGLGARELDVGGTGADELELSVPSHQEHLTSDGQRYTTYEIVVQMGGRQWSVRKRYSQFDQFRMSLRKQHKEVGSFRFPNKSKFNTFSEHTKERRRTGFDEFLRLVAGLHPRPQEVDVFLAMDEHGAGVRGRSGSTRPLAWTSGTVSPADTPGSGPAIGRDWAESGRAGLGRQPPSESGVGRPPTGAATHRIPRFPPLADQGRSEKEAEAEADAAAAAASSSSKSGPSGVLRQADLVLRQLLGPDLLSVLCVVAVSAVSIVAVWKVGGKPGLATLVMAVGVGLFIQNWDKGYDLFNMALELVGIGSFNAKPPPSPTPSPTPSTRRPHRPDQIDRPRAESAVAALGRTRPIVRGGEGAQQ